jgi:predicted DNA-binding transcriptional regulator YafY
MARNEQLIRQHKLLQVLERYRFGRTLAEMRDELVEELGLTSLHTRSVRRDIEALQAAGFDVASTETARGRVWKLGPRFRGTHQIAASSTELMALSLGRDLMHPLAGTPFWLGIESFWNKIQESLPDGVWSHYQKYRKILHVLGMPAKSYEKHQGMLKTINRAILEHRVLEIEYQRLGQSVATMRRVEPYGVAFYHSSLYVVADTCDAPEKESPVRHLKLDRFKKATALDQWFKPREEFDLEQHLQQSMGMFAGKETKKFKIKISAYAAPWVEEDPWHPEQEVKRHADGSITLTVKASHDLEVIPRILALGTEAELLSPVASRRLIAETIRDMRKSYENASAASDDE